MWKGQLRRSKLHYLAMVIFTILMLQFSRLPSSPQNPPPEETSSRPILHDHEFVNIEPEVKPKAAAVMPIPSSISIQKTPLTPYYHPEKEDPALHKVCLVIPAFTKHGGIESWFKSLHGIINSIPKVTFYGIFLFDVRHDKALEYLQQNNIYAILSQRELESHCHIILSTAYHHLKNPYIYQVQVIHGSGYDNWTWRYARFAKSFNHVVAVSYNSLDRQEESVRQKSSYIPSYVQKYNNCSGEVSKYKYCDHQVLFVGRMSSEKRPELFCKALCEIPHCGVMIGPYYFQENRPKCDCENVHIIGDRNDAQCFMRHSEFLFVTSDSEGGPVVAIEGWLNEIPIVMKRTGLAVNYPGSFLIYDWDKFDGRSLSNLLRNNSLIANVKANALVTWREAFSEEVIRESWKKVMDAGIEYLSNAGVTMNWDVYKMQWAFVVPQGRHLKVDCFESNCEVGLKLRQTSSRLLVKFKVVAAIAEITFKVTAGSEISNFRIIGPETESLLVSLPEIFLDKIIFEVLSEPAVIVFNDFIFIP